MTFAAKTRISVLQTQAEIGAILARYGATKFKDLTNSDRAIITFEVDGRVIRFEMELPGADSKKNLQIRRSRWRALLLCIKAKLESVASNIETFEEAFMAHIVMPDDRTLFQHYSSDEATLQLVHHQD